MTLPHLWPHKAFMCLHTSPLDVQETPHRDTRLSLTAGQVHQPFPNAQGAVVVKDTKPGAAETSRYGSESPEVTGRVKAKTEEEMGLVSRGAPAWYSTK